MRPAGDHQEQITGRATGNTRFALARHANARSILSPRGDTDLGLLFTALDGACRTRKHLFERNLNRLLSIPPPNGLARLAGARISTEPEDGGEKIAEVTAVVKPGPIGLALGIGGPRRPVKAPRIRPTAGVLLIA